MDSRSRRAPRPQPRRLYDQSSRVPGLRPEMDDTGGYVEGILAPPAEIADYLNRFAAIGVNEILISPLGTDPLAKFLDRFDAEVRPHLA